MELDIYHYTHIGGRSENQDAISDIWDGDCGLFTVCDGLGGHQGGALASKVVIKAMEDQWEKAIAGQSFSLSQWLPQQINRANQILIMAQARDPLYKRMKSTLVALGITPAEVTWAHVGDSRLYYIHGGKLDCVTSDHSVSYKKYLAREISRNEINTDEDRSSLLGVVGDANRCKPQVVTCPTALCPGDGFLLCSDGFWEHIYDDELVIDQCSSETAQEWVESMLMRILPRLSPTCDNITALAILVK